MENTVDFDEYIQIINTTNVIKNDPRSILLGMLGEAGSIVSLEKKSVREGQAFDNDYSSQLIEEMGDFLWYFIAYCNHLNRLPSKV